MFYVSDIKKTAPDSYQTHLQKSVYEALAKLHIPYERVHTDEAITMDDCTQIDKKLNMKMVKTLFLCNRQKTNYYLFVTCGDKPFRSKEFSTALGIPRVSFAPVEKMESMLKTKVGAATVFSALCDKENKVRIVFDKDILAEKWYGCSDGTTTGYMKIQTEQVIHNFLAFAKHTPAIIEV